MARSKVAISLDSDALERLDRLVRRRVFPNRSRAIQEAVNEKLERLERIPPQRAGFPLTLELHAPGLPKRSWVKISQIRPLAAERIGKRLGKATPEELAQILEGLNEILGA